MIKRKAFAVFTYTLSNQEYMVRGNFGSNKESAEKWAEEHQYLYDRVLFVKQVDY